MKKFIFFALTALLFLHLTGCVSYIMEQRQQGVAECDKFAKIAGHQFVYCPSTNFAIAKKGAGQYTVVKPTGEMTAYYDDIKYSEKSKDNFYFIIQRGKQQGVMNLDGKIILPFDNYTGAISYRYPKGFAICGAYGSIGDKGYKEMCYDEMGNRALQY